MADNKLLQVTIRDTEKVVFKGEAERVSSFNEVGRFDVLPMHANFISMIKEELKLYNRHALIKEFKIGQAIMKVKKDVVHIFIGIESFTLEEELGLTPHKS